jgi:DNA-damage-inducible protein J
MAKSEVVKAKIEPDLKFESEAVLSAIGLSTTDSITIFFCQIVMQRGLPFDAKIPNAETVAAMQEDLSAARPYATADEMIADVLLRDPSA